MFPLYSLLYILLAALHSVVLSVKVQMSREKSCNCVLSSQMEVSQLAQHLSLVCQLGPYHGISQNSIIFSARISTVQCGWSAGWLDSMYSPVLALCQPKGFHNTIVVIMKYLKNHGKEWN